METMYYKNRVVLVDKYKLPLWIMKDGKAISIKKMDNSHIRNTLSLLKRWFYLNTVIIRNGIPFKFWVMILEAEQKRREKVK